MVQKAITSKISGVIFNPKALFTKRLKKELSLLDVYAIATGTTLSAGFFLLPGIAAIHAGPALILSYFI